MSSSSQQTNSTVNKDVDAEEYFNNNNNSTDCENNNNTGYEHKMTDLPANIQVTAKVLFGSVSAISALNAERKKKA
jgi:hypothetical protein